MADVRALPAWRRSAGVALVASFAAVLLFAVTRMMFSRFMLYDDEGYVLLSLRNFAEHGHLYREVYSQYGPVPYVLFYFLHLLGVPLTHTVGRLVTLGVWTGAVLLCASIVWRFTQRYAFVVATIASLFVYLWVMVNEPPHPGGLIVLLTAALASVGGKWLWQERPVAWSALAGGGAAALALTKINVGVFAAASAGAFLLLHHANDRVRRWAPVILATAFAVLPFALMRQLLHAGWVQTYALLFALGAVATIGAAAHGRTARFGASAIVAAGLAATGVVLLVVVIMLFRGTTPADLVEGVLIGPLRHPISFNMPIKWAPGARAAAMVAAAMFATLSLLRRRGRQLTADVIVAALRLLVAAAAGFALLRFPSVSADTYVLSYGLSCLWLFAWPLDDQAGSRTSTAWIALLLLGQFLHPFPVPGSQIAWGTFLSLPLVAIGTWQAVAVLRARFPLLGFRPVLNWGTFAALVTFAGFLTLQLNRIGNQYFVGRNLALAGAEPIRLPDEATARYQVLSFNALAHSDLLFSLPGMFSFNLWTGLPTPTLANVTHWFSLLTPSQQTEIIRVLDAHPRAAVIVSTGHVDFLRRNHLAPAGPLYDYIERTFAPVFSLDQFEFRVRKGRRIAPFFTAEVFKRPRTVTPPDPENTRLVMPLSLPHNQSIARIEIVSCGGRAPTVMLQSGNTRLEVSPINAEGRPVGPVESSKFPLNLTGPTKVALYFDGQDVPFSVDDTLIVLRNAAGAELGLVRLRP